MYTTAIVNGKLVITVDVDPTTVTNSPLSSTGKSRLVATSHGYSKIEGSPFKLSMNVIAPR